jgi:hypothetical protein
MSNVPQYSYFKHSRKVSMSRAALLIGHRDCHRRGLWPGLVAHIPSVFPFLIATLPRLHQGDVERAVRKENVIETQRIS